MMSEIQLSPDQARVLESMMDWYKSKRTLFITVGGYAGTGKTTLLSVLRRRLYNEDKKLQVAFCSYTGKAARVLQDKLVEHKAIYPLDGVSTIHSLIYSPMVDDNEDIIGWERKEEMEADMIIVDEASMVDRKIWDDLISYGVPIVAVGDHGQLPPISGKFNLVEKPILRLEQIHRQAEGNPIIQLSIRARNEGKVDVGEYSPTVKKYPKNDSIIAEIVDDLLMGYDSDSLVLCGYNNTRGKLNMHIRSLFDLQSPLPEPGDRVICLRNNHMMGIFNGMTGVIETLQDEDEDWYFAEIDMGEGDVNYEGLILKSQFGSSESMNFTDRRRDTLKGDLFDFGYAVTVHKAQGSQARRVILFEERFKQMDDEMWRRWLYTAVTRASEELYIIG